MRRLHLQADRHSNLWPAGHPVPRRQPEPWPRGGLVSGRDRILVADDDPASADLLKYFLESHGFTVETAPDGNRALEMGTSGEFQLVILDMHMPMYDGVEGLEFLRKRRIARTAWEAAGFAVEVATSALDALECLMVMTPSLVVVDEWVYRPTQR